MFWSRYRSINIGVFLHVYVRSLLCTMQHMYLGTERIRASVLRTISHRSWAYFIVCLWGGASNFGLGFTGREELGQPGATIWCLCIIFIPYVCVIFKAFIREAYRGSGIFLQNAPKDQLSKEENCDILEKMEEEQICILPVPALTTFPSLFFSFRYGYKTL